MALLILSGERQDALVAELRTQAAVDSLTGLVTRRVLDEAASSALSGAASAQGTGLILLDLDHFKHVNDEHGHLAGDEVLVQVSKLLLGTRSGDTVSRMGGDEIAVLLAGCSVDALRQRAEQILSRSARTCSRSRRRGGAALGEPGRRAPADPRHEPALALRRGRRVVVRGEGAGRDRVGPMPEPVLPSPVGGLTQPNHRSAGYTTDVTSDLGTTTSTDAFAEFVRPHWAAMARLARRMCGPDWEDVLQDALALAWRTRERFDASRGAPRTWLLTLTADQARKNRRAKPPRGARRRAVESVRPATSTSSGRSSSCPNASASPSNSSTSSTCRSPRSRP